MQKLNSILYNKIILQAEEAREFGMEKLAKGALNALPKSPRNDDEDEYYPLSELKDDLYSDLWKMAVKVIDHHDLDSVDISKLDEFIEDFTESFLDSLESHLNVEDKKGKREPTSPGEEDEEQVLIEEAVKEPGLIDEE